MTDGLILLGLLAILFAILVGRGRKRIGLPVNGRFFAVAILGFVIVVLALWTSGTH